MVIGFNKRFQKKSLQNSWLYVGDISRFNAYAKQISKNIFALTFFSFRLAEFCTNFHKRGEVQ